MPYREGDKGSKGSKIPNIVDMASTGIGIPDRLDNKPIQKYGLFAKF